MALAAPKWDKDDIQWVQRRLMPYFGIKALKLAIDDSTKRWPDCWAILGNPPQIVVTREFMRQDTHERRKRFVHEALHIGRGLEHGMQPNGLNYSTYPKNDTYSKAVYQAMLRGDRWARNPLNPKLKVYFGDKPHLWGGSAFVDSQGKVNRIRVSKKGLGRHHSMPSTLAHEIGHWKTLPVEWTGLRMQFAGGITDLGAELSAWEWALNRPGNDINLEDVRTSLMHYVVDYPREYQTRLRQLVDDFIDRYEPRNPLNPHLLFTKRREAYFGPNKYDPKRVPSKRKQLKLFGKTAIVIGEYPDFNESKPMMLAHEIGHSKDYSPKYGEFLNEAKAWMWALQKLPPKEIDLKLLAKSLISHSMPYDIHDAIMTYAKARKEGRDNPLFIGWQGPAWRVPSGYHHERGQTAADVLRFEEKELGNRYNVPLAVRRMLRDRPAHQLTWVTKTYAAASRYGKPENVTSDVHGARIIAEDGDGGYLVLLSHEVRL